MPPFIIGYLIGGAVTFLCVMIYNRFQKKSNRIDVPNTGISLGIFFTDLDEKTNKFFAKIHRTNFVGSGDSRTAACKNAAEHLVATLIKCLDSEEFARRMDASGGDGFVGFSIGCDREE